MRLRLLFLSCLLFYAAALQATEVDDDLSAPPQSLQLQAPLTTFVEAQKTVTPGFNAIQALIRVPEDAPADLGVGAFVKDDDGNWFQLPAQQDLGPGTHHLHFSLDDEQPWQSEPYFSVWHRYQHFLAHRFGLYFWSQESNPAVIEIIELRSVDVDFLGAQYKPGQIQNMAFDNIDDSTLQCSGVTGKRWSMRCEPEPMPENPYDSDQFALNLHIDGPDGQYRVPGFYQQPMRIIDGGDRDRTLPDGAGQFAVRFRPRAAGDYHMRLEAVWHAGTDQEQRVNCRLPTLQVSGDAWDEYVRIDDTDKRFFRVGIDQRFHWPLGMNIRSVTDPRGAQRTTSVPTPERIVQAYSAYFERLSRAGANSCEIWMASWNVGLEWLDDWPGFHGIGAYHEGNAQRLDEILDAAWANGIRVILVINNHGQASYKTDREWSYSPFNARNGGPLENAKDFFTHAVPLHAQQERRRYIVARYGDHPAVMCWKLFSEMNLTDMARNGQDGRDQMRIWHANAFDAWRELDIYDRPVTSHWSGDYRTPFRDIVALPHMDFTAIDAYHGRRRGRGRLLADIMYHSTLHKELGLAQYNKPVVCTEFGASAGAGPEPQLIAEHMSGPWAALMSGHGSAPHLWWYEWTDQGDRWHPYRALSRYLAGEDLRSPDARCVHLQIKHPQQDIIWCRAWFKPACIYAYLLDWDWGYDGVARPRHQGVQVQIGTNVRPGEMELEWWDASIGTIISSHRFQHPGGALVLDCPDFRRHLALKIRRKSLQADDVPDTE